MSGPLQIGFIPLVDAAALLVAVDKGFAAEEGVEVNLLCAVAGIDIRRPAIKLPGLGRLGASVPQVPCAAPLPHTAPALRTPGWPPTLRSAGKV